MNTQAYITLWHKTLNSVTRMHEWTRRGFEYVNVHVEDKIAFFEKRRRVSRRCPHTHIH